eukprot:jgi/Mesvir1/17240/Mv07652-RA.2
MPAADVLEQSTSILETGLDARVVSRRGEPARTPDTGRAESAPLTADDPTQGKHKGRSFWRRWRPLLPYVTMARARSRPLMVLPLRALSLVLRALILCGRRMLSIPRRQRILFALASVLILSAVSPLLFSWRSGGIGSEGDRLPSDTLPLSRASSQVSLAARMAVEDATVAFDEGAREDAGSATASDVALSNLPNIPPAEQCLRPRYASLLAEGRPLNASASPLSWVSNLKPSLHYNHMITMARMANGTLAAAWQASVESEGSEDQHIRLTFSTDKEGRHWQPSRKLKVRRDGAQWSPVLHFDVASSQLFLFFSESRGCIRPVTPPKWAPGGDIKVTRSKDGVNWSPPRVVHSMDADGTIPKVIANKMVVLSSGEWLLPYWRENLILQKSNWPKGQEHCRADASAYAGVLVSADSGQTWQAHGRLHDPKTWLIENTLVERSDGSLLMLFRTHAGFIYSSVSKDKGVTWSQAQPTTLPNPDSKIMMLRMEPSGHIALVYNNHARVQYKMRNKLTLALSLDDGATWVQYSL